MATTDKKQATRTTIDELNEKLSSAEQSVEQNKKKIIYVVIALVVIVAIGFFGYKWYQGKVSDTKEVIGQADSAKMEGNDSLAVKLYKQAAEGSGKYANRANLEAALILYNQGKNEDALKHLAAYDSEESMIGSLAQVLKGDCNVNLKKYDDAISCSDKAVSVADGNQQLVPYAMYKKSVVLAAQNKHAEAAKVLEEIDNKYPMFDQGRQGGLNIKKLLEQEKFRAGK